MKKYKEYLNTPNGKKLLDAFKLTDVGLWQVKGADSSCGGLFDQPQIKQFGYFQGSLENVIKHVVKLDGFWGWGDGGIIWKSSMPNVTKV